MRLMFFLVLATTGFAANATVDRGTKFCTPVLIWESSVMGSGGGFSPVGRYEHRCIVVGPVNIVRLPSVNAPSSFKPPPVGAVSRLTGAGVGFLTAPPSDEPQTYQGPGSYAHFAASFLTTIYQREAAKVENNKSVKTNLDSIRNVVNGNSLRHEVDYSASQQGRSNLVTASFATLVESRSNATGLVDSVRPSQLDLIKRLEAVDAGAPDPSDIAALPRQPLAKAQAQAALESHLQGSKPVGVTSFGAAPTKIGGIRDVDMLLAAIESQSSSLDGLPPSSIRDKSAREQAQLAFELARRLASKSLDTANFLFVEGFSASLMATGENSTRSVAVYRGVAGERASFVDWKSAKSDQRLLVQAQAMYASIDAIRRWVKNNTLGVQAPRDSLIDTTERLADQAEDFFAYSPIKSLGGLFRARLLIEQVSWYGGWAANLNSWSKGATRKLGDLLKVRRPEEEIIRNASKDLLGNVLKLKTVFESAGTGELVELIKLFSDSRTTDLIKKIKSADIESLQGIPRVPYVSLTPPVPYWISEEYRNANFLNTNLQLVELTRLRAAYQGHLDRLNEGTSRMAALSKIADKLHNIADNPTLLAALIAAEFGVSTGAAASSIANAPALGDLRNAADDYRESLNRLRKDCQDEIQKVDMLIQDWMLARPDKGIFRALFIPPLQVVN